MGDLDAEIKNTQSFIYLANAVNLMLEPKTNMTQTKKNINDKNETGHGHPKELNSISQTACACSVVFLLDRKEPRKFSKWFE